MPRQGQSVESCVIGTWHKKKGDKVTAGDILFTYETDKSTFEEEAKVDGVILAIYYEEGDDVECLKTVCLIGEEGENVAEFGIQNSELGINDSDSGAGPAISDKLAVEIITPSANGGSINTTETTSAAPRTGFMPVSPRARALADRTGADLSRAVPTGAEGRIIEKDVIKAIENGYHITQAAMELKTAENRRNGSKPGTANAGGAAGTGIGGRYTVEDMKMRRQIIDPVVSVISADARAQKVDAAQQMSRQEAGAIANAAQQRVPQAAEAGATAAATADAADYEEIAVRGVRKYIAKAMQASLSESAQLTLHSSFDATDIFNFRKNLKTLEAQDSNNAATTSALLAKITVTDIIVYAVSRVLPKHKSINAHFMGETMRLFSNAHIGVAVDTPRGLLVPTLFNANKLSLTELSTSAKALFEQCRQGKAGPETLRGGTFTISNLGGMGIEMFTPILNPPQTGILGVCCAIERTKEGKTYPAMGLSLTFDHRAMDGADAARFLKDLVAYLEEFSVMLAIEGGI